MGYTHVANKTLPLVKTWSHSNGEELVSGKTLQTFWLGNGLDYESTHWAVDVCGHHQLHLSF